MIIVLESPADARRDGISINKIGRVTPMPNAVILLEERHALYVSDEQSLTRCCLLGLPRRPRYGTQHYHDRNNDKQFN